VKRPLDRDRRTWLRVVVERLSEGYPEEEEQQCDADADGPPDDLPAATAATAFLALDGRERRHGE
jgi:hypothetical protein